MPLAVYPNPWTVRLDGTVEAEGPCGHCLGVQDSVWPDTTAPPPPAAKEKVETDTR